MNPRVAAVTAMNDHVPGISFSNREKKRFDVTPYLGLGLFNELRDDDLFATAKAEMGTVTCGPMVWTSAPTRCIWKTDSPKSI